MPAKRCASSTCNRLISAQRSTRKYCSDGCRQQAYRNAKAGKSVTLSPARTVHGNNTDLLRDVARLHIPDGAIVLDATYGKGVFWRKVDRRFTIIGSDLMTPQAAVRADCRQLPYADGTFDVVALDPPYLSGAHVWIEAMERQYRNLATVKDLDCAGILELYRAGIREARRVLKPRGILLVKCQDQTEKKQWFFSRLIPEAAEALGFKQKDLFILVPTKEPNSRRWANTVQRHARKYHSYLLVLQAPAIRLAAVAA